MGRMVKACIKTESEIERFRILQAKVDSIVVEKQQSEVDFGDIPDEFRGMYAINVRKLLIAIVPHNTVFTHK